jgi:hypothetical protein
VHCQRVALAGVVERGFTLQSRPYLLKEGSRDDDKTGSSHGRPCIAATVTANALGSGVNGPETAQTGLTVNISKDNWWTGGKVGEIDGINVMLRQNAPGSDGSGILINVQNQGNGFLSATEFASTIVDPARTRSLTRSTSKKGY